MANRSFGFWENFYSCLVEKKLNDEGYLTQVLDGDNVRSGINNNLAFTEEDRLENIRRISEVSKLFLNCGVITINCFVSPTEDIRDLAKEIIGERTFWKFTLILLWKNVKEET